MDKIIMKGMRFYSHHGILPHERKLGQIFVVDVELFLDLSFAGKTDNLDLSVSYAEVFEKVEGVVAGDPMNLIEAVAEKIAGTILDNFSKVQEVRVIVQKPSAPVQGAFEYMAVEIVRKR
ncbi:MAG: dihydroneopterin aldolase [Bacillota bacterium]